MGTPPDSSQAAATDADPGGEAHADAPETELAALRTELRRVQAEMAGRARALRFQEALFDISEVASSSRSSPAVLAEMHRIVGTLMYAENFFIARWDGERRTLRFAYFADSEDDAGIDPATAFHESELPGSLTLQVILHRTALCGPSADIARSLGQEGVSQGPECEHWLGVPMLLDGEAVGAVVVQSYRPEVRYSEDDAQLLTYVAEHIATALARRESTLELERRVEQRTEALQAEVRERQRAERLQSTLYRIAALSSRHEAEDADGSFFADIHAIVGELIDARNFYIALWDEATDELSFPYSVDEHDLVRATRRGGRGLTEYVLHHGEPLLATEAIVRGLAATGAVTPSGPAAAWWLGVPMRVDDQPVGVIAVQSYHHDVRYTERDLELLGFVGTHIAAAIGRRRADLALRQAYLDLERRVAERTRELGLANETLRQQISAREGVERQLKHQTLHDSLTGLPNRQYLLDRLVAAMAQHRAQPDRSFAVLFLDLDRFKVINDSEGHLVGDALLREAAQRIGECVRSPDTLARLGGDEFAVLLERLRDVDDAIHVAERIMQVLDRPFLVEGRELHTSASVGIAVVQPQHGSAEEILRDADAAMYRAKADGRKRYALFDEHLRHHAQHRLELELELRRALATDEFEPHYQPIVNVTTGAVLGFEALLRWRRADGSLRTPDAFLALAEETGLIEAIDWRMYALAIGDLARLRPANAYVSVNLSPRHLLVPEFAERFLTLVAEQRAQPSRVCVEVTEGALIDRKDLVRAALETLHRGGVRVMLDDFGTGYSALSYLQHFPLHGLKIDRSFAAALASGGHRGSRPIVRAIVAMASSLELEVVSEGIETEEQRQTLWALGIRQGQGYHFGRPAPLQHWLDTAPASGAV
ncbi:MAG TPA: hypothetical protein DCM32_02770 [Xanthomonadaceae bacterium]|jgi:diguanylate cyclase (GGDEF)-like protein|nr:hypothetical protein [Xanthomonadaceae bacterium]